MAYILCLMYNQSQQIFTDHGMFSAGYSVFRIIERPNQDTNNFLIFVWLRLYKHGDQCFVKVNNIKIILCCITIVDIE